MQNKISTQIGDVFIMSILAVMSLVSVSCGQVALPEDVQVKTAVSTPKLVGVGILGDSNSDEYQADDHRGGAYAEHTLNWPEQLGRRRGVNFGKWGEWDEPRRQGYAYNWARSGATAASMIQSGQHTGLAAQVAAGDVSHVIIYIGTNDVNVHSGF